MHVLKFGGTSVGSAERMQHVAQLIQGGAPKIVVLSAVSGTTNKLLAIADALQQGTPDLAQKRLQHLETEYQALIRDLLPAAFWPPANTILNRCFSEVQSLLDKPFVSNAEKLILAQGELISTQLFHLYLTSINVPSALLPALDFMRIDENQEPDSDYITERLKLLLEAHQQEHILITQGYICCNPDGAVDNLQRGGSDYTATLIGAAIQAQEIQIWTDIDGLHNNDPRIVPYTTPVRQVSYREAAELAFFGAKILHPTCVIPAERQNVPIRLKNTFAPDAVGTLISDLGSGQQLTAIAAKGGITALKIRSGRMLNAYGFLRKVFEVFEHYRTPIDMITTSEVSVSLTIDQDENLEAILEDLRAFGEVSVDQDHTIICIVGDALNEHKGYTKHIFSALEEIPIRMVSYGGSNNNISILVPNAYKKQALLNLHEQLFTKHVHYQAIED